MSLSKGLAAALRSARKVRGLSQQGLGDAGDRKHLWQMENGKSSPTLNKLEELSQALNYDPVTLLTLCIAVRDDITPDDVLKRAQRELIEFEQLGGMKELAANSDSEPFNSRTNEKQRKLAAVQACKREGLTQKATMERLGMPKSTVHDLWKLATVEE